LVGESHIEDLELNLQLPLSLAAGKVSTMRIGRQVGRKAIMRITGITGEECVVALVSAELHSDHYRLGLSLYRRRPGIAEHLITETHEQLPCLFASYMSAFSASMLSDGNSFFLKLN